MKLNELSPATGSVREAYRKGRGAGSGNGKTAGKWRRIISLAKFLTMCYNRKYS